MAVVGLVTEDKRDGDTFNKNWWIKVAGNLSPSLPWDLSKTKWASTLNPLLANPLVNGRIIPGVVLVTGANVINHGLGRKLQGYFVVLNDANETFWDNQATNSMPDLTLVLNASGPATVSLYVF